MSKKPIDDVSDTGKKGAPGPGKKKSAFLKKTIDFPLRLV